MISIPIIFISFHNTTCETSKMKDKPDCQYLMCIHDLQCWTVVTLLCMMLITGVSM